MEPPQHHHKEAQGNSRNCDVRSDRGLLGSDMGGEELVLESIASSKAGLVPVSGDCRHRFGMMVVPPGPRAVSVGSEFVCSYRLVTCFHWPSPWVPSP